MKKWFLAAGAALLLALSAVSCVSRQGAGTPDSAFAAYVKAYTGGVVQSQSPIRIELATPVPMEAQGEDLFSFSPSVKGMTRWLSPTSVEFVPEVLEPGKVYHASFQLGKALSVKESALRKFNFSFKVAERRISLDPDGILIAGEVKAGGSLRVSEPIELADLEKAISVSYPTGKPVVKLSGGPQEFEWEISNIERSDKDRTLNIKVAPKGFAPASASLTIPAQGHFKVIDARIIEDENPAVLVSFSEPLSAGAASEGLIEIDGVTRSYVAVQDNVASIFYEGRQEGPVSILVNRNLKCVTGETLGADFSASFESREDYPAVKIPVQGNILPDAKSLVLPIQAVNLSAVDVKIIRIYENNILAFLQENDLDEDSSLRRSGRLVYSKEVRLDNDPDVDLHKWNNFAIDLSGLVKEEPGAIYRVRISFKKEHSLYGKDATAALRSISDGKPSEEEEAEWDVQSSYYWESFIDWDEYEWNETDDPTKASYYMDSDRFPTVNILASDLGLTAQYADGKSVWVSVSDLNTATPRSGIKLEVYDYQLQRIGTGSTKNGLAEIEVSRKPFIVVARSGKSVGYLKLGGGYEKSFSRFDTGGATVQKGLKGFVYGERGVWRPGDTLHVTLMVGDRDGILPEGHPATMELYTPEGRFYTRMVQSGTDGFYAYAIPTASTDPTGYWNAYFKVGGSSFHKGLHIETIKPNRLKINLDLGSGMLSGNAKRTAIVTSSWLTGPPAASLRTHATMTLTPGSSRFDGFDGYIFRNPVAEAVRSEHELFDTKLDENGRAGVELNLPAAKSAPGMLNAFIVTSVEENGGDESFTTQSVPYSPFDAYVGVKFPGEELETDKDNEIKVAVVSPEGKRIVGHELQYAVYKLEWRWWWESRHENLDSYVNGRGAKAVISGTLTSAPQDVSFKINIGEADWGRYLVFVRDTKSGHASGKVITIDWPAYRGRADRQDPTALTMLTFSTDKKSYLAGEKATVYIPSAKGGRALVSIENGSKVISRDWVSTKAEGDTPYSFKITGDMAPNFYIHITLLQPYGASENDLPLRMYGVQRILVENPASHLEPVIKMADSIAPEEDFTVKVSEKNGREMTYTLAIVDEGLLDVTAFKTPSPWDEMYKTEALGVRTYDLYDQVIGAFSGRFSPMLSVGGDEEGSVRAARKDNRFNPVVKFLGPFKAGKGGNTHKIRLPMYVGSVRVMVVAGHNGAYGSAEKAVAVKAPLMVLSTLPRVIATGEQVTLPVNVFAMEDDIREAVVSVSVEGPVTISGAGKDKLTFEKKGDKIARFALETTGEGIATIHVNASGAGHKASESISIQVKNPNPETVKVVSKSIAKGASAAFDAAEGATIELATFPAIDALGVFTYMKNYPYDCSEQLSARGLTLLSLMPLLGEAEVAQARQMIPEIISKLYSRQNSDGGFIYWPSSKRSDSWVSSMAGSFLAQASAAGFPVQRSVLNAWEKYQKNLSQAFRIAGNSAFSETDESYRLYSLAVAGDPQNGAMNRLKEAETLGNRAKWILAAAYAVAGKTQTAKDLIGTADKAFEEYDPADLSYGSSDRDKAIALEVLALTGNLAEALPLAGELAESFGRGWYSTQEAAFTSVAMHRLHEKIDAKAIVAEVGGQSVTTAKSVYGVPASGNVTVKNNGEGLLYATMVQVAKAPAGTAVPAAANGIQIKAVYTNLQGQPLSVKELRQGTEFICTVTVSNPGGRGVSSLALRENIPSGWEIQNERLRGGATYAHQDIRDDGCRWFFDLPSGAVKSFQLRLRAAYEGTFTLPSITCEAMYEPRISARTASETTRVVR